MKTCVVCKHGHLAPGTTSITLERGKTLLVLRHLPALLCDACGESYLAGDVSARALALLDAAEAAGIEVEIREYAAA